MQRRNASGSCSGFGSWWRRAATAGAVACACVVGAAAPAGAGDGCAESVDATLDAYEASYAKDIGIHAAVIGRASAWAAFGCIPEGEQDKLLGLLAGTDPLLDTFEFVNIGVDIDECFLGGGMTGEEFGEAKARLARLEKLADVISDNMFDWTFFLLDLPVCE